MFQIFDALLYPLKRSAMKVFAVSLVSFLVASAAAIVIDSPDGADCFSSTDANIDKEVVSKDNMNDNEEVVQECSKRNRFSPLTSLLGSPL